MWHPVVKPNSKIKRLARKTNVVKPPAVVKSRSVAVFPKLFCLLTQQKS